GERRGLAEDSSIEPAIDPVLRRPCERCARAVVIRPRSSAERAGEIGDRIEAQRRAGLSRVYARELPSGNHATERPQVREVSLSRAEWQVDRIADHQPLRAVEQV